jgi:hypothetical protein
MWMANRVLQDPSHGEAPNRDLGKHVVGLATALHWFGEDKRRAAQAIASELDVRWNGPLGPSMFRGLLSKAFEVDRRIGLYRPMSPAQLEKLIVLPEEETFPAWRWHRLIEHDNEVIRHELICGSSTTDLGISTISCQGRRHITELSRTRRQ